MEVTASPVFASSISYELGRPVPLALLDDSSITTEYLKSLRDEGLRTCRVSSADAPSMGAVAARQTLLSYAGVLPTSVLYLSESHSPDGPAADLWALQTRIEQPRTSGMVIGGNACGNLALALRLGTAMVRSERRGPVLVVTADRIVDTPRAQPVGTTILSDGAGAFMLTDRPIGPSYRVLAITSSSDAMFDPHTGEMAGARAIIGHIESAREQLAYMGADDRGFQHLVTGNYGSTSRQFLAMAAGAEDGHDCAPSAEDVGHCFAADLLINLDLKQRAGSFVNGDRILLVATSTRSWSLVALEFVDLQHPAGSLGQHTQGEEILP